MPASSPPSAQAGVVSPGKEDNPELARFRAEWLEELQRRKAAASGASKDTDIPTGTTSSAAPSGGQSSAGTSQPSQLQKQETQASKNAESFSSSSKEPAAKRTVLSHPALSNGSIQAPPHISSTLERALKAYRQAVEHEQKGDLDQALILYRQAFRLDDNVDRAFRREEMLKSILKEQQAPKPSTEMDELAASFKEAAVIHSTALKKPGGVVSGTIASLVADFLQNEHKFEPDREEEPVLLNMLPEELLVVILGNLDSTSIERFARVSKKARVVSLDPGIWRKLVQRTYLPPQIPDYDTIIPVIENFSWDFRRVYIEQPRLRLDGVYIATCHYVRPGLSENSWVNTSHLITYHRYLRFYPNGQVLSLLANGEHLPQHIIPILKPTLRMNGLFFGQWSLMGTTVSLTNLIDASGRFALPMSASSGPSPPPQPFSSSSLHASGGNSSISLRVEQPARYAFLMTLNLRSRPLGRWNRMDIESYESVNIETGDIHPIVLKHERPFWFSKVRSYAQ